MKKFAPIALFVYNRPWHTQQTVEALKKNNLALDSDLFIYSDGFKSDLDKPKVLEVRNYIRDIKGFKSLTIKESQVNKGLADSIIAGVTEIVNKYGRIIVLEDDIVTSLFFLKYMNDALELYKNEEKVMHVSGYLPPLKIKTSEHFFIKPTSCWGWGTWQRSWRFFIKDPKYFLQKFNTHLIKDFNVINSYPYYSHIIMNLNKEIKTWAIFWYASSFFNNGLSLHPNKSLTHNIGFDGTGIHCDICNEFNTTLNNEYIEKFPSKIELNYKVEKSLATYYKKLTPSLVSKIINKIFR